MTISVGNNTYQYYYPDDYSLKNNKPQNNNPKPKVKAQDTSGSGGESSALGLLLASEAIRLGSEKASKMLMRGKEYTTSENVLKVVENMLNRGKLNDVSIYFVNPSNINEISSKTGFSVADLREVAEGKNAFFSDSFKKVAVAPSSKPSLIQHELGHAINARNPFLKVLQTSRRVAPYIPTALILANSLSKRLKKDNEETFIEKHAGKIGFAAYLPTIIEEGLVSMRGILAAKKTLGGQNIKLGALKRNYFFAWMTYLLAGLGLGVASKLSVKTGIPMQ